MYLTIWFEVFLNNSWTALTHLFLLSHLPPNYLRLAVINILNFYLTRFCTTFTHTPAIFISLAVISNQLIVIFLNFSILWITGSCRLLCLCWIFKNYCHTLNTWLRSKIRHERLWIATIKYSSRNRHFNLWHNRTLCIDEKRIYVMT